MFEEFSKSLKATLYDRMVSPLFGAFIISWVIWNYRMLLVLMSSMKTRDKFSYIDQVLYPNNYSDLLPLFLYPIGSALWFIILYPYPAKWVYSYSRQRNKELREVRQTIENETQLTIEESRKLKNQFTQSKLENEKELLRLEQEVETLKSLYEKERQTSDLLRENLNKKNELLVESVPKKTEGDKDVDLEHLLLTHNFRFYYDPSDGSYVSMEFVRGGKIFRGRRDAWASWEIVDDELEFLNKDGRISIRFSYIPEKKIFLSTDESGLLLPRNGQYLSIEN